MPLIPVSEAPSELLTLFHTEKESILARCYEPEPGLFIAESAKVTVRAAQAGYEIVAMLIDDAQINREARDLFLRFPDTPAYHAPTPRFLEISGYPMTRGVLSLFRRKNKSKSAAACPGSVLCIAETDHSSVPEPAAGWTGSRMSADTASSEASQNERSSEVSQNERSSEVSQNGRSSEVSQNGRSSFRIAVLDHVGNPANIGVIFRNAAALGVDSILLTKGCCDPLSRRCLRVSMGCVFLVPFTMTGLTGGQIAGSLKQHGIRTAAMALSEHSVSVRDPSLKKEPRLALFFGNEGDGLPQETIRACDLVVRIPMNEGVDSLNVAASSAVAFWELQP